MNTAYTHTVINHYRDGELWIERYDALTKHSTQRVYRAVTAASWQRLARVMGADVRVVAGSYIETEGDRCEATIDLDYEYDDLPDTDWCADPYYPRRPNWREPLPVLAYSA